VDLVDEVADLVGGLVDAALRLGVEPLDRDVPFERAGGVVEKATDVLEVEGVVVADGELLADGPAGPRRQQLARPPPTLPAATAYRSTRRASQALMSQPEPVKKLTDVGESQGHSDALQHRWREVLPAAG